MRIIKKINNNVAIGIDGNGHEAIVLGRGIGFETTPYELLDLNRIDRTFYDVNPQYYNLLPEIPSDIIILVSKLVDLSRKNFSGNLNPNLVFVLSDHIHFSIERARKNLYVPLPYSYELEYEYPDLTAMSKWFLSQINKTLNVSLPFSEVTSITMHFLNAIEGTEPSYSLQDKITEICADITQIVENHFGAAIDQRSFHYFRFKNHIKYLVIRKEQGSMLEICEEDLFVEMQKKYPQIMECANKINQYLTGLFQQECSHEELLYLMIHINQLYTRENDTAKYDQNKDFSPDNIIL